MRRFILLLLTVGVVHAEVTEEVIIVIRPPPPDETVVGANVDQPRVRGDVARRWFEHPEQTYLDSSIGPVALYIDPVFDAAGNPAPRFPQPYAKQLFDDPGEDSALGYLEANKARLRRIKEVTAIVERTAAKYGYVVPEDFERKVKNAPNPDAYGALPIQSDNKQDWGEPIFTIEQARLIGLDPFNIPLSPRTAGKFEVWYLWDHRVQSSVDGMRDFVTFATSIQDLDARVRLKTISVDNDRPRFVAMIDYLAQQLDVPIKRLENYVDYTDLRTSLNLRWVPTYVFVDQRRGKIHRLEGVKSVQELQQEMLSFLGNPSKTWDPKPEWFLDAKALEVYQRENQRSAPPPAIASEPLGAGQALPPSQPVVPWNPARN
jgi:hypothetical protein